MPNPTPFRIPAQRVPLVTDRGGLITRDWYRFLNAQPSHGSFYDTTNHVALAPNTPYAVTFNSTASAHSIGIGTPTSRIVVPNTSTYNFQFSLQMDKTSGGDGMIYIWARVNGVNVPDSASRVRIKGNNAELVPAWNFMLDMQGGSYFELMWAVDDTSVRIVAEPATAFCPVIPSAILTAFEVSL